MSEACHACGYEPVVDWQARALAAEAKLVRAKVVIGCLLERVAELEALIQAESAEAARS